jgi:hypothetical protein
VLKKRNDDYYTDDVIFFNQLSREEVKEQDEFSIVQALQPMWAS